MLLGTLALLVAVRSPVVAATPRPMPWVLRTTACVLTAILTLLAAAYFHKDAVYSTITNAAFAGRFDEMSEAYRRTAATWFPTAGEDLWCSRVFAAFARAGKVPAPADAWTLAAEAAARAEATSDNQAEAAFQFALVAIGTNHAPQAEFELRKAIAAAPTWYKPHLLLAQFLHFTGRGEEAQSEARTAIDLAGTMRQSAEQTLLQLGLP